MKWAALLLALACGLDAIATETGDLELLSERDLVKNIYPRHENTGILLQIRDSAEESNILLPRMNRAGKGEQYKEGPSEMASGSKDPRINKASSAPPKNPPSPKRDSSPLDLPRQVRAPPITATTPQSYQIERPKPPSSPSKSEPHMSLKLQSSGPATTRGVSEKKTSEGQRSSKPSVMKTGGESFGSVSRPSSPQDGALKARQGSLSSFRSVKSGSLDSVSSASSFRTAGSLRSNKSSDTSKLSPENTSSRAESQIVSPSTSQSPQQPKRSKGNAPSKAVGDKTSIENSASSQNRSKREQSPQSLRGNKISEPLERQSSANLRTQSSPSLNREPRPTHRQSLQSSTRKAKAGRKELRRSALPQQQSLHASHYPIRPPPPPRRTDQQRGTHLHNLQKSYPLTQTEFRPTSDYGWAPMPSPIQPSSSQSVADLLPQEWPPLSSQHPAGTSATPTRQDDFRQSAEPTNQTSLKDTASSASSGPAHEDRVVSKPSGRNKFGAVGSGSPTRQDDFRQSAEPTNQTSLKDTASSASPGPAHEDRVVSQPSGRNKFGAVGSESPRHSGA